MVVSDIVDAVEFACRETKVDRKRVFLLGTSGGGYASLLMAGKRPDLWAGVSAWVPISDLRAWHKECKAKDPSIEADVTECSGKTTEADCPTEKCEWVAKATVADKECKAKDPENAADCNGKLTEADCRLRPEEWCRTRPSCTGYP